jgi:hypothetical protein
MKGVPRYYDDILRDECPERYEEVKKARLAYMKAHSNEYSEGRLMSKHIVKKARVKEQGRPL